MNFKNVIEKALYLQDRIEREQQIMIKRIGFEPSYSMKEVIEEESYYKVLKNAENFKIKLVGYSNTTWKIREGLFCTIELERMFLEKKIYISCRNKKFTISGFSCNNTEIMYKGLDVKPLTLENLKDTISSMKKNAEDELIALSEKYSYQVKNNPTSKEKNMLLEKINSLNKDYNTLMVIEKDVNI